MPQVKITKDPIENEQKPEDLNASATEYIDELMNKVSSIITSERVIE